jgi:TonB family protein
MKRLLICAALVCGALAVGGAPASGQGATSCDSPCKVTHLPLVGPRGAVCDSPCKLINLPLVQRNDQPVPTSNPLRELQGSVHDANAAYFEYQVDLQATMLPGAVMPHYPDSLKTANVEGEVVASFIVDTLGAVDPYSVKILKSTHPLFTAAVYDAILKDRFRPAELHGAKVRELVQRPFVFNIPR